MMLKMRVPMRELKPGDVFLQDGVPMTLRSLKQRDEEQGQYGYSRYETTEPNRDGHRFMYFYWETYEVEVVSCSAPDIAKRVVEELARFDTAVIREVCAAFCPKCGEREWRRHR